MRKILFSAILSTAIVLLTYPAAAVERHVPSEYSTIQAAINACNSSDIVIIAPGTYTGNGNRDIDFLGKAITVRSTDPYNPNTVAATIIDIQNVQGHRGFYFHSGEDTNSIVFGLTITNGQIYPGIKSNPVDAYGGGIFCGSGTNPSISNCIISNNLVRGSRGRDEYVEYYPYYHQPIPKPRFSS